MQCNWCGKTYTNGYGGGYCSRRCYEEGHRRTCRGCGRSFTGSGYSGSGIIFGAGGDWCSEACYQKNASPTQKKADAATAKIVWTVILACVFPPLLFLLYWKQTLAVIKFLLRIIFSKFFWKYVVPIGAILTAVVMYLTHRDKVEACELEMSQFAEAINAESQQSLEKMKDSRMATLKKTEQMRHEAALRREEEVSRQKAELAAAIAAAKAEQQRVQEADSINVFAREQMAGMHEKLATLAGEIEELEKRLRRYTERTDVEWSVIESDPEYIKVLILRNKLTVERRTIEQEILKAYHAQRSKGAQK